MKMHQRVPKPSRLLATPHRPHHWSSSSSGAKRSALINERLLPNLNPIFPIINLPFLYPTHNIIVLNDQWHHNHDGAVDTTAIINFRTKCLNTRRSEYVTRSSLHVFYVSRSPTITELLFFLFLVPFSESTVPA